MGVMSRLIHGCSQHTTDACLDCAGFTCPPSFRNVNDTMHTGCGWKCRDQMSHRAVLMTLYKMARRSVAQKCKDFLPQPAFICAFASLRDPLVQYARASCHHIVNGKPHECNKGLGQVRQCFASGHPFLIHTGHTRSVFVTSCRDACGCRGRIGLFTRKVHACHERRKGRAIDPAIK